MKKINSGDMTQGTIGDKLFLFAVPLALTGILQQLFNAADVAVLGQFVGKTAMAAVGSDSPVIGLLVNLFIGISLGTNVVIANFTGAGNRSGVRKGVHTSILIALICGVIMAIIGELISEPLLHLLSVPENVFDMALLYLRIYFAGLPFIFLYDFEGSVFRSQGNTRTPLIALTVSGVTNVILNLFFVLVCKMTVDGVALATVISNIISSGLLFVLLIKQKDDTHLSIRNLRIDPVVLKRIFAIGFPAGLQNSVFALSNICIQSAVNSLGSDIMAASSAAFNIEIVAYYILNAFGQGCTTFTSQNYGAGKNDRCKKILKISLLQDMIVTIIVSTIILSLGNFLLRIFNSDTTVLKYGKIRLWFIVGTEPINVLIEIFSGALRGYGKSLVPALIALFGICGIRIGWVYTIFRQSHTFSTLMADYPVSWIITAIAIIIAYFIIIKKIKQVPQISN